MNIFKAVHAVALLAMSTYLSAAVVCSEVAKRRRNKTAEERSRKVMKEIMRLPAKERERVMRDLLDLPLKNTMEES